MGHLKNIVLSSVLVLGLLGCPDKKEIVEVEKEENASFIHSDNNYFLKGERFDFTIDEKQDRKLNEKNSVD